mmetsp:Transcript_37375/g.108051  ORF Transcript_37375/g.108051 Transcript_37375/m.108051 type:complete len:341 (+) Transcript_37375:47-1069(+)
MAPSNCRPSCSVSADSAVVMAKHCTAMNTPQLPAGATGCCAAGLAELSASIAEFAADTSRSELELPRGMSAEERKQAKLIVDQHQGLKCESYGFGSERRLHVFKDRVRVKNTFIDDWVANPTEAPHCRSLPPGIQLCGASSLRLRKREEDCVALSPIAALSPVVEASPGGGGAAAARPSRTGADFSFGLPDMPEGAHFMAGPAQEPKVAALASPLAQASETSPLPVGTEVVVDGLSKLPAFNGQSGVVRAYDAETGRYTVVLDQPVAVGATMHRNAKVRIENLRGKMPPPPPERQQLSAAPAPVAPTLLSRQGLLSTGPRVAATGPDPSKPFLSLRGLVA